MPELAEWHWHPQVQSPPRKLQRLCATLHAIFPPTQVVHELLQQPPGVEWTVHLSTHQRSHVATPCTPKGAIQWRSSAVMYSSAFSELIKTATWKGVPSLTTDRTGNLFWALLIHITSAWMLCLNLQITLVEAGATWLGFRYLRQAWHCSVTSKTADASGLQYFNKGCRGWTSKISVQSLHCTYFVLDEELDHLSMNELAFIDGQGSFPKDRSLWDSKCSSHGCSKAWLVILKEACPGKSKARNLTFKLTKLTRSVTSQDRGLHHSTLGGLQNGGHSNQLPGMILIFASSSTGALVKSDALAWQAGKRRGVPTARTLWLFQMCVLAMTHLTHKNGAAKMKVSIMMNLSLTLQLKLFLSCGCVDVHHLTPQVTSRCKPNFVRHVVIKLGQKLGPMRFQIKIPTVFVAKRFNLTSKRFSDFSKSRGTCIDLPNQTGSGLEVLELLRNMLVQIIPSEVASATSKLRHSFETIFLSPTVGASPGSSEDWKTSSSCR